MPADVINGVGVLLNASQAAKFLGISRSKFYEIRASLPVITLPDGTKRYNSEQLEWWLSHNTTPVFVAYSDIQRRLFHGSIMLQKRA